MMPFFSVLMAAYNVEDYIEEAIESIISQTFKDWELIIIDDASTDMGIEKAKKFDDERIKIIRSYVNSGGCFVPRITGAEVARGSFIVHLDGDDVFHSEHLQKLYDFISRSNSDMVIPEMWRFESSAATSYKIFPINKFNTSVSWEGKNLVKYTLPNWKIPVAGYAVRKKIFLEAAEEVKKLTNEYPFADELQSRLLLYMSPNVSFCDSPYYYRINSASLTSDKYGEFKRLGVVNSKLIDFTEKFYGKESPEYEMSKLKFYFFILSLYTTIDSGKMDPRQKLEIKNYIKYQQANIDFNYYKGKVSSYYYYALKWPEGIGKPFFKVIQRLKKLIGKI